MPDLLSPMVNPSTMHECPTRGKRMLVLRGTTEVEDQVFRDVRGVMDNILEINVNSGITLHPFLLGWLSLAAPPETPQSIRCSRAARYNLQPMSSNCFT